MKIYSRYTGEQMEFSAADQHLSRVKRMRKRVWYAVKALAYVQETQGGALHMITLTYAGVGDWGAHDVSRFVRWCRSKGARHYVWVAELQRRGAVHYHALVLWPHGELWVKPGGAAGGWAHGFTWVTPNVRRPFYIMKYLQKGVRSDKKFPRGMRLYGMSAASMRCLPFQERCDERLSLLPRWLGAQAVSDWRVLTARRVIGGIDWWGLAIYSPYSRTNLPDVDEVSRRMYADVWSNSTPQGQ
jgi:hypothetical protein